MNKLFKYIGWMAAIVTIVAGLIGIYFALHEKQIKLDIQTVNSENLTAHETVQNLSIKYYYLDSIEVNNLWKTKWIIRNVGDKTIVGTGSENQLLNDGLPLHFKNKCRVLSLDITSSSNDAILKNQKLLFKQWRRDEYVELTAFIESNNQPDIYISDRDIIDSEISYSTYTSKREYNSIADHLPIWLNKTLKVIYLVLCVFMILAGILTFCTNIGDKSSKIAVIILFLFMMIPIIWIF
jgi:hypothetical protein